MADRRRPGARRKGPSIERFLVTCEHGGNRIPSAWTSLFAGQEIVLESHRGYDQGALAFARELALAFGAPLECSTTSRLLVDLNRSMGHRRQFSEFTRGLPGAERREIVRLHHAPYRERVENHVADAVRSGDRTVHIACHSFTPVWNGVPRRTDIGFLHEPSRPLEVKFCREWKRFLGAREPDLAIRRNDPYRGGEDCLPTHLRRIHSPDSYLGIELEINQRFVLGDPRFWSSLRTHLIESLRDASKASIAPHQGETT